MTRKKAKWEQYQLCISTEINIKTKMQEKSCILVFHIVKYLQKKRVKYKLKTKKVKKEGECA